MLSVKERVLGQWWKNIETGRSNKQAGLNFFENLISRQFLIRVGRVEQISEINRRACLFRLGRLVQPYIKQLYIELGPRPWCTAGDSSPKLDRPHKTDRMKHKKYYGLFQLPLVTKHCTILIFFEAKSRMKILVLKRFL